MRNQPILTSKDKEVYEMKKVWILEKWLTPEAMEKSLSDMKEIADNIAMEAELNHNQRSTQSQSKK